MSNNQRQEGKKRDHYCQLGRRIQRPLGLQVFKFLQPQNITPTPQPALVPAECSCLISWDLRRQVPFQTQPCYGFYFSLNLTTTPALCLPGWINILLSTWIPIFLRLLSRQFPLSFLISPETLNPPRSLPCLKTVWTYVLLEHLKHSVSAAFPILYH